MERMKLGALLGKIESTYGTDPTPTGGSNAIPMVRESGFYEAEGDYLARIILDGGLSELPGDNAQPRAKIKFSVELLGNGSIQDGATVHAYLSPLLKSCDMSETATAESTGGAADGYITYNPSFSATAEGSSMTFYAYTGLKLHKVTGAKGTFKMRWEAGKRCYLDFEFTGIYNAPTDASIPSLTFAYTNKPPLFVSASTLTWGSYTPVISRVNFDIGNKIGMRPDATAATGIAGFCVTDRSITGDFDPESKAEATSPMWADWRTPTLRTLTAVLGSTAGSRFTITTTCVPTNVNYADRNETRIHQVQLRVVKTNIGTANGAEFALKMH